MPQERPLRTSAPPAAAGASAALRRGIYALLIALAAGSVAGRILAVDAVDYLRLSTHLKQQGRADWQKSRPFLSANDRSRWATIRALVEHGTYQIDEIVRQPNWDTIDIVRHRGRDGQLHFYSSKPPLLATILAAEYWLVYRVGGWSLGEYPHEVGRFMLLTINLPAIVVLLWLLSRLVEELGTTDWGRVFVVAAGAFGTFLTTFANVLNNHLLAATFAMAAVYFAVRIVHFHQRRWTRFAACGGCAALTVVCELPALALLALLFVWLLWRFPRPTLTAFLPPAAVVAAASVGVNYLAHDSLRPPYAHRSATDPADNWYVFTYQKDGKTVASYWSNPQKIDKGEASLPRYVFHALAGHHGIFSLTPLWLLSVAGLLVMRRARRWLDVAALVAIVSLVCVSFYLFRPLQIDRNYGGMTAGFRWVFWLAPLWLLVMVPAADTLSLSRARRWFALALLALSALSASYPTWNPWTHPWLTNFMVYLDWAKLPQ